MRATIARLPGSDRGHPPRPDRGPRAAPRRAPARLAALVASLMLAGTVGQATAQGSLALALAAPPGAAPGAASPAGPDDAIRTMIERAVGPGRRVEVKVGQLDPRLQLAPCRRAEPYLPTGVRLWGRASIGVRCVDGATWAVLLPVTVSVYGPALVATAPVAAGAAPAPSDFVIEEIDLTREPTPVVEDPAELAGKTMLRPLAPGQALRRDAMRTPPAVAAGDPVRIVIQGQGFTITGEGIAMSAAAEGQKLRVRTENGRVVTGEVSGRTVELRH